MQMNGLFLMEILRSARDTWRLNSAHADWGRINDNDAILFVEPTSRTQDVITNIGRAQSTEDEVIKVLQTIYNAPGSGQSREFVERGLKVANRDSWNNVLPAWKKIIDEVDTSDNKQYEPAPEEKKPIYIDDLLNKEDKMRILFTMPESAGDVLLSTGVVKSLKKKYPFSSIYFATKPKYKEILKYNGDIARIIPYDEHLINYDVMQKHFAIVLTPHFYTQRFANWVRGGMGGHLIDQYANHCVVDAEKPCISYEEYDVGTKRQYVTLHVSSCAGQWQVRKYSKWQEVINGISNRGFDIVQIGDKDDIPINGTIDLRGKTNPQELASVILNAELHLGIDSFPAHLAGVIGTKSVILFPNTYPQCTGPLENCTPITPQDRYGCTNPCHRLVCKKKPGSSCNETIDPKQIINTVLVKLGDNNGRNTNTTAKSR